MICDEMFGKREIAAMELEICSNLKWFLTPITILAWLRFYQNNVRRHKVDSGKGDKSDGKKSKDYDNTGKKSRGDNSDGDSSGDYSDGYSGGYSGYTSGDNSLSSSNSNNSNNSSSNLNSNNSGKSSNNLNSNNSGNNMERKLDFLIHSSTILNFTSSKLAAALISETLEPSDLLKCTGYKITEIQEELNWIRSWQEEIESGDNGSIAYADPKRLKLLSDDQFDDLIKNHRKSLNFILKKVKIE